nr:STAS domain-containing protein [Micromonospora sp. DSM 115978]
MTTFTVRPVPGADLVRLELRGELDLGTAPEFNAAVDRLIDGGRPRLLVDLTGLAFCDSIGMAAFVRGDNRASAAGGWLRLTGACGRVERVLRISGLAEVLRFEQDHRDPGALQEH